MQKWIVFGTAIVAIALFAVAGILIQPDTKITAESDSNDYTISVSGSATTELEPNRLFITLGVETVDTTATDALNQNNEQMASTINALRDIGIQEDEFSTSQFSIYPMYDYDRQFEESILIGFTVINTIQVETEKLDLVTEIIDVAANAGANNFNQLSFGVSPQVAKDAQDELIAEALSDARQRADRIAESLDVEIIGIKQVSLYQDAPYREAAVYYADARSTPVFSDNQDITTNVNVVFLIKNP